MKKFAATLFAATFVLSLACGKGKEASKQEEGEDDVQTQTAQASGTAGTAAPVTSTAAAAPAVSADAATVTGSVKFEGAAPKMAAIQMSADPYCQSQHSAPATDEDVVVGSAGE